MYSYFFYGLALLGLFSIIQILREGKQISNMKFNILLFLIIISIGNSISFLKEIGYDVLKYDTVFGILITFTLINLFILLSRNKIKNIIFIIEFVLLLLYFIAIISTSEYQINQNGQIIHDNKFIKVLNIIINISLIVTSFYSLFKIYINSNNYNNNLYILKIKKWTIILFFFILSTFVFLIFATVSIQLKRIFLFSDRKFIVFILRLFSILFIIFRPRFIDDIGIPQFKWNEIPKINKTGISSQDFDFIFFSTNYYLNPEANLEDFALKLNHRKSDIIEYLKLKNQGSFHELITYNRIKYFTELLKSRKYESLTIEALSELSGFGSRKTMYIAFHKFHGITPTEFINKYK